MSSFGTSRFVTVPFGKTKTKDLPIATSECVRRIDVADEALIKDVQAGNREALALLFRRYARLVWSIGERILRDKVEADDLVQEVFLYLQRKSRLFDSSRGAGRSWIVQVAYTQALLRRRELRSHGFYQSGMSGKQVDCPSSGNQEVAHYEQSVEGLFGRNGWKKIVEDLTEDQRETLRLHFFEGFTFAEIAEKLGQSHRNIRNHHYRGLEKLRKHMTKHEVNTR